MALIKDHFILENISEKKILLTVEIARRLYVLSQLLKIFISFFGKLGLYLQGSGLSLALHSVIIPAGTCGMIWDKKDQIRAWVDHIQSMCHTFIWTNSSRLLGELGTCLSIQHTVSISSCLYYTTVSIVI